MKTPQPWPHPLGAILLRVRHRQEQKSIQGNHPCGSFHPSILVHFFSIGPHGQLKIPPVRALMYLGLKLPTTHPNGHSD